MADIVASFTNNAVPLTSPANAPTIRIRRNDTQALVVTDLAMTEIGDGLYSYAFAPTDGIEYSIRADGDPTAAGQVTADERYQFGSLSGSTEARLETDIPAILVDTGTSLPADIAALPSAADNADAVWDEPRAGHAGAGSFGEFTGDAAMRGTDGANTVVPLAAATDQAEHDASQAAIAALNDPDAAAIADAVWDEPRAGHSGVGTYGEHTGDAAMRGTDGANTVVPMAAATSQAEHDASQAAIAALNDLAAADITAAVWGVTEAVLAAEGEAGLLFVLGLSQNTDIDFTGNDALGWQLVINDTSGTEIARANLFDEAKARIPAATTVAAFIAASKSISRVVPL